MEFGSLPDEPVTFERKFSLAVFLIPAIAQLGDFLSGEKADLQ